jgi:hypothetical protein
MPRRGKVAAEEKVRIVELYLSGKIGRSEKMNNTSYACGRFILTQPWFGRYK